MSQEENTEPERPNYDRITKLEWLFGKAPFGRRFAPMALETIEGEEGTRKVPIDICNNGRNLYFEGEEDEKRKFRTFADAMDWLSRHEGVNNEWFTRPYPGAPDSERKKVTAIYSSLTYRIKADDPFVFVDLDHVYHDGELKIENEIAKTVEREFGRQCYRELSQSGTGLHFLIPIGPEAKKQIKAKKTREYEIYADGRWVMLTGNTPSLLLASDWERLLDPEGMKKRGEEFLQKVYRPILEAEIKKNPKALARILNNEEREKGDGEYPRWQDLTPQQQQYVWEDAEKAIEARIEKVEAEWKVIPEGSCENCDVAGRDEHLTKYAKFLVRDKDLPENLAMGLLKILDRKCHLPPMGEGVIAEKIKNALTNGKNPFGCGIAWSQERHWREWDEAPRQWQEPEDASESASASAARENEAEEKEMNEEEKGVASADTPETKAKVAPEPKPEPTGEGNQRLDTRLIPTEKDEYGFGGPTYDKVTANMKVAATEKSLAGPPERNLVPDLIDLIRYDTNGLKPIQYCFAEAFYIICAALCNNRFVQRTLTDAMNNSEIRFLGDPEYITKFNGEKVPDPDFKPERSAGPKLLASLATMDGKQITAPQVNILVVGRTGSGKGVGWNIANDMLADCGKKVHQKRTSPEKFIDVCAELNNGDHHFRTDEASSVFDKNSWHHEIVDLIIGAFNDGKLETLTRQSKGHCYFAFPSAWLEIQPKLLKQKLNKLDLEQGLFRRTCFFYATKKDCDGIYPELERGKECQRLTSILQRLSMTRLQRVNVGKYPEKYKPEFYAMFPDEEDPMHDYIGTLCNQTLPLIAFALWPRPDIGQPCPENDQIWERAATICRYLTYCAQHVQRLAGTYNEQAEKEVNWQDQLLKKIAKAVKQQKSLDGDGKVLLTISYGRLKDRAKAIYKQTGEKEFKATLEALEAAGYIAWERKKNVITLLREGEIRASGGADGASEERPPKA